MGQQEVKPSLTGEQLRSFRQALLRDLEALEYMLAEDLFDRGPRRIGAEQEMFLVAENGLPAPAALAMLEEIDDPHFTTELALFNLEANLDPQVFKGRCLRRMEEQLNTLLAKARTAAATVGARVALVGILPTIRKSDLDLENMTPFPRYHALNDALTSLRGEDYEFRIRGIDELLVQHDSVMVEACNCSFQAHLQVTADEFATMYNIAQVLAAPVLAAATNSPMLFGRRLWAETRIALFEQAVDTRPSSPDLRETMPRVSFGRGYVKDSVLDLFREDVTRFRALLTAEHTEDPMKLLKQGIAPKLPALCLHNGTVYRWNRACYGVTEGKPHLRIENRILPAGPTPVDEIANCALWFGLMLAMAEDVGDVRKHIPFEVAVNNFHNAAQQGYAAQLTWLGGQTLPARQLILTRLLPQAREGLASAGINKRDIDRYLGVIAERMERETTGSHWALRSFNALREESSASEAITAVTEAMIARQGLGRPVARWELARLEEGGDWKNSYVRVEHFMTTDLYTVQEDEPVDLVANLMDWNRIRHVLVEDQQHRLVGLVSYRSLLRVVGRRSADGDSVAVSEIMTRNPITVEPETPTLDAINLMRQQRMACLPVVKDDRLVGVVTERDFMDITAELLEAKLRE